MRPDGMFHVKHLEDMNMEPAPYLAPLKGKKKGRGQYQRNVTADEKYVEEALPKLTDMQQKFVNNVLSGMLHKEAYRDAYGSTMAEQSISTEAYKLLKNPKIQQWIGAATKLHLVSGAMSFERWLADQQAYIQQAIEEGAFGTAMSGHKTLGIALGYIGKKEGQAANTLDGEKLFQVLSRLLPPILGMSLWNQVQDKLAPFLIGGPVHNVRMIEGTTIAVKENNND